MWASELQKLLNSLLLALFASEWFRAAEVSRPLVYVAIGINGVLSQYGLVGFFALTQQQQGLLLLFVVVASLCASLGLQWWKNGMARPTVRQRELLYILVAVILQSAFAVKLVLSGWIQIGKVVFGTALFAAVGFLDVRRCLPDVTLTAKAYARHLAVALMYVTPLYPFIAVACTPILLLIVDIFESKSANGFLNELVFDGTFYSPFVAVYILAKRRCLNDPELNCLPLPTKAEPTQKRGRNRKV